mgnify:CR=1 FL=1
MLSLFASILASDILPIFLIALAGYLLAKFAAVSIQSVSRVVFYALMPCLAFRMLYTSSATGPNVGRLMALGLLTMGSFHAPRFQEGETVLSLGPCLVTLDDLGSVEVSAPEGHTGKCWDINFSISVNGQHVGAVAIGVAIKFRKGLPVEAARVTTGSIREFVEERHCRHLRFCQHFGERPPWDRCDACDICGVEVEWTQLKTKKQPKPASPKAARAELIAEQGALGVALREWRKELAKSTSVPAYVILHDTTIAAICEHRPETHAELLATPGIGERKAEKFGEQILALVAANR